ncbi:MAG TPA: aldo/keto reductase, partial [Jatrophihabitantaceae bacterium]|nr:aldo/keto reductase [Jatrophihabitantaceae bacterium]
MRQRQIGSIRVGAIGLGAMQLDDFPERAEVTVRAALDAGITLIDTAIAYGPDHLGAAAMGENERLVASILDRVGARGHVVIATKGGHVRTAGGGWGVDSSATHLRSAVDASLANLGVEQIDLYQHHRPDPKVPYGDAMTTLKELHDVGKVRMVGISNASRRQILQARDILGDALVSVQNEYSPRFRSSEVELQLCDELDLAFLAWSPLGGADQAGNLGGQHTAFGRVGAELGISPQQVCLAWMLAKSPRLIPIPGASRPESISDSAQAAEVELSDEQLALLDG